jgi:chromosome segregation ATPase
MDESSVYNESDLAPFRRRLNDLHSIIKSDSESGKHPDAMTRLLERQLGECEIVLNRLQDNLSVLSSELVPLHERLVTIRRKLVTLAAKGVSPKAELKPLQEELRKLDSLSICLVTSTD